MLRSKLEKTVGSFSFLFAIFISAYPSMEKDLKLVFMSIISFFCLSLSLAKLTRSFHINKLYLIVAVFFIYVLMHSSIYPSDLSYATTKRIYIYYSIATPLLMAYLIGKIESTDVGLLLWGIIVVSLFYSIVQLTSEVSVDNIRIRENEINPLILARLSILAVIAVFFVGIRVRILHIFLILITLYLALASVFLTGSRGPLLALAISGIFYFLLTKKQISFIILTVFVALLLLLYPYYSHILPSIFTDRLTSDAINRQIYDATSSDRLELFETGFSIAMSHPVMGIGLGNFVKFHGSIVAPHNIYIEYLTELGIVGFLFITYLLYIGHKNGLALLRQSNHDRDIKRLLEFFYFLFIYFSVSMLFDGELTIQCFLLYFSIFFLNQQMTYMKRCVEI